MNKGKIKQIIGAVVDVEFSENLPGIYHALTIERERGETLVLEVQQHIGSNIVRTIAMGPTEGLQREIEVADTGAPIHVPVGEQTLGRMFDVLGNPIDGKEPVKSAT
ncbi:MAG TPA: F0F1 ATP synthase subunit beta, partial [Patescibacteria group bacterium]|nr:F0F1 ATP synthase subunit beta [Patescibacteria group bacterium]